MPRQTLYVIDFDRTLADVDKIMDLAEKASDGLDIDFSAIREEQRRASEEAWSYSPLESIGRSGEHSLQTFEESFLKLAAPDELVFPDGIEYIKELDSKKLPYLIMTYASDSTWQQLKLKATGLFSIPHIITFNKLKGREISSWRRTDGRYKPPLDEINPADSVTLIDDRLRVFSGLPPDCSGYFLNRPRKPYDKAELPDNVHEISGFEELVNLT